MRKSTLLKQTIALAYASIMALLPFWVSAQTVTNYSTRVPGTILGIPMGTDGTGPQYNQGMYLPANYDAENQTNLHPLLIVFGGYTGQDFSVQDLLKTRNLIPLISGGSLPSLANGNCIVVCSETLIKQDWPNNRVEVMHQFVNDLKTNYRVDPTRVYLGGFSWGAAGIRDTYRLTAILITSPLVSPTNVGGRRILDIAILLIAKLGFLRVGTIRPQAGLYYFDNEFGRQFYLRIF